MAVSLVAAGCGGAPPSGSKVFFPKHKEGAVPQALGGGKLVMDEEGCIRLLPTPSDRPGYPIIWPPDYSASVEGGEIRILNEEGRVEASVGDEVRIVGGFVGRERKLEGISGVDERTKRALMERCPGVYWYAGEVESTMQQG